MNLIPFRRMLVCLSGLDSDCALLRYAARIGALSPGMSTLGIHVTETESTPRRKVELRQAFVDSVPGGSFDIVAGDVLDSILEVAVRQGCDVVLLGHKQGARRSRSLARRLAMKAPCSVWMVPDGFSRGPSRILVPVDFSPRAADSLEFATRLAGAAGVEECTALHVYFNPAKVSFDDYDQVLLDGVERAFSIFAARVNLHGVDVRPMMVESPHVAQTVLRIAGEQRSDLIVMGTRGRSRSASVLLGSETEHALIHTSLPLLAVKHFGARMRLLQALRDERVRRRTADE